ncbi:o-succinylbenzoate synthase [Chlorobium ferrooxidans]|uniref:o-succinylbenzoate synthase n=1 Tax=Chlorobium ferrooxidans DSM 13031 TaxID=377431 RepID=Q0YUC8_9CHLB|nr:o-succinylbenzoate synthase [Chlorobium ferrooxidans]EAT60100.1 Mandelate racemase/muconate lactonizing enzyme [Chlorobium ferrooxidans DSM 13031]
MRASHVTLYRYSIPFTEPVTVKGVRLLQREGIIIGLTSRESSRVAYGEIAPLPGLHRELFQSAEAQLIEVLAKHNFAASGIMQEQLYPSVRTGLEMAMINLETADKGGRSAFSPLSGSAKQVPLNALLFGDTAKIIERAELLFNVGYRTFKLKITAGKTDDALRSLEALHRTFGRQIELRLDANQSLMMDEALDFARSAPAGSIEYIEEPLQDAELIGEFHAKTGLYSALDETLWQKPEMLSHIPVAALKALILKPNRLGGISVALHFARYAQENRLKAVFSSAFESGVSLSFYTMLAASLSTEPAACGLDTFRYLEYDLLESPFGTENGVLDAEALYLGGQKVNEHLLKRTSLWTL